MRRRRARASTSGGQPRAARTCGHKHSAALVHSCLRTAGLERVQGIQGGAQLVHQRRRTRGTASARRCSERNGVAAGEVLRHVRGLRAEGKRLRQLHLQRRAQQWVRHGPATRAQARTQSIASNACTQHRRTAAPHARPGARLPPAPPAATPCPRAPSCRGAARLAPVHMCVGVTRIWPR